MTHPKWCIVQQKPIYNEGLLEYLVSEYGGVAEKYQHVKGDGVIDCDGIDTPAEVHWL